MKTPRWMKSTIATSAQPMPAMPFARATRSKPAAFKSISASAQGQTPRAIAAK
ncbi:hypothetical protein SAMN05216227_101255 [Pseudorhodobacter antarcticus]|uniref:Uncharacterized protein n=1 Tax=Pseudorhodobacter antarcticus TaxID=1077947 RepID=A0A1H8FXU1_9RHOB|nr:hypothetical protein [Pseudorhodobacter antarcticus]SEN36651.1 hypothetical protein SAMN05216227_101255 [Pseudorhodobacter antarcticus]